MLGSVYVAGAAERVGKTFVSVLLLNTLLRSGCAVGYFKPVCAAASHEESDPALVAQSCSLSQEPAEMTGVFYRSDLPVHLAVRSFRKMPDLNKITDRYAWNMSTHEAVIVEGTGGAASPLVFEKGRVLRQSEIIRRLKIPKVILVTDAGSVSSCVCAASFMSAAGTPPDGIILNAYDDSDPVHKDAVFMIEEMCSSPVIAAAAFDAADLMWRVSPQSFFAVPDPVF